MFFMLELAHLIKKNMAIIKINVQHIYGFTMITKLHENVAMYLTYSICIYQIIYYDLFSILFIYLFKKVCTSLPKIR